MIYATRQHQKLVLDLISAAFHDDPQFLAYTKGHPAKIRLIALLIFETCLASNTIFLNEDLNAVALCKPAQPSRPQLSISLLRVMWIKLMFPLTLGPTLFLRLLRIEHALEKKRPLQGNQLYVWLLATHPKHQGKGLASGLLEEVNALIPSTYHGILLETAKLSNVAYYAKRGYQIYDEIEFGQDLTVFFMHKK